MNKLLSHVLGTNALKVWQRVTLVTNDDVHYMQALLSITPHPTQTTQSSTQHWNITHSTVL